MAHEEDAVHVALKRVDRARTVFVVAVAVLFVAVLFPFGALLLHAPVDSDDGRSTLLFAASAALMAFVGACTVLLAFHVSRMTRAVLQAIELAGKR